MSTMKFSSVLFGVLVDACCDKQESLMRDSLHDKRTSTLSATNHSTIETVDDTPPVIYCKARHWSTDIYTKVYGKMHHGHAEMTS